MNDLQRSERGLRVAIAASYAPSLLNFRRELIVEAVRCGYEVFALAPEIDFATRDELRSLGAQPVEIQMSRTGLNPVFDVATIVGLIGALRKIQPDVYLGYTIKPVVYGLIAAAAVSVPRRVALITGLGYSFGIGSIRQRLVGRVSRTLYKVALRLASAVIVQNKDDRKLLVNAGLVDESKCYVIDGSGVNVAHFKQMPFPSQPLTFLMIARLLRDKGIREFLEAAKIVKEQHPSTRFLLVGPTEKNPNAFPLEELREFAAFVEYIGAVNDVRQVLASCHVYVLPSYREGIPRTVLEAMAVGRPIITTDAPGCRETVCEGKNGYLVPVRDSQALASAMLRFTSPQSVVKAMGEASREYAVNRFDVRIVNTQMLQVLAAVDSA